jgi:hypothetical protein
MTTLEERGFGARERRELDALSRVARAAVPVDLEARRAAERESENQREARVALYRWFVDWSTTARALIGRKDWLVSLGLAGRKRRG